MFEPGQEVYFICNDHIELVKFLGKDQLGCVIEFYDDIQRVNEETLTDDTNEIRQYINGRIDKYESRIAVLKAKLQDFPPLRLTNE